MTESLIEAKKAYARLRKECQKRAKKTQCLWCGKTITHFCNSHSVPKCVLKNIEVDGKVDYYNAMVEIPFIEDDKGIANAGIFRLLCEKCDGTVFQDYEDNDKLEKYPSEKMLEEIALKNLLLFLNKRYYEEQLYQITIEKSGQNQYITEKQQIVQLDERDYLNDYVRVKEMMESPKESDGFNVVFYRKLDYVVPVAFQGPITLYGDLEGNVVVDMYDKSEDITVKFLHLCVFPLEHFTVVILFYNKSDREYDSFAEQFQRLDEDEKLELVSYMLYGFCEDMLIAKKFPHRTWFTSQIKSLFAERQNIYAMDMPTAEIELLKQQYKLVYRKKDYPCILDRKFAIR